MQIDTRITDQDQVKRITKAIGGQAFAVLSTVSDAGFPHAAGIAYDSVGSTMFVHTMRSARKTRNIATNDKVAIVIPRPQIACRPAFHHPLPRSGGHSRHGRSRDRGAGERQPTRNYRRSWSSRRTRRLFPQDRSHRCRAQLWHRRLNSRPYSRSAACGGSIRSSRGRLGRSNG